MGVCSKDDIYSIKFDFYSHWLIQSIIPVKNVSLPSNRADELVGSSRGRLSNDIMVSAQYAPLINVSGCEVYIKLIYSVCKRLICERIFSFEDANG